MNTRILSIDNHQKSVFTSKDSNLQRLMRMSVGCSIFFNTLTPQISSMGGRQSAWKSIVKAIQSGLIQHRKPYTSMAQSVSEPVSEGIFGIVRIQWLSRLMVI
jgi:hypothetical protein